LAWDCGARHYYQVLIHRRLVLNIFFFSGKKSKMKRQFI
jgi:hypothetical protein